jgi:hypothetical protein
MDAVVDQPGDETTQLGLVDLAAPIERDQGWDEDTL